MVTRTLQFVVNLNLQGLNKAIADLEGRFQLTMSNINKMIETVAGSAIKLEENIIAIQGTLSATNEVIKNGVAVSDPLERITALRQPVLEAIGEIREASLELAGVTSDQLIDVFQIISAQVGQINASLDDAVKLTIDFSAALGTLNIPLFQAQQEVASILMGTIDINSRLAKQLNITNEQVRLYKEQGRLVEELGKRFEGLRAAQALTAKTFSGVTSNIAEQFERLQEVSGKIVLPPLLESLTKLYEYLASVRPEVEKFVKTVAGAAGQIIETVSRGIQQLQPLFATVAQLGAALGNAFSSSLVLVAKELVNVLVPLGKVLADVLKPIAAALQTELGQVALQAVILSKAFTVLPGVILNLVGSLTNLVAQLGTVGSLALTLGAQVTQLATPIASLITTIQKLAPLLLSLLLPVLKAIGFQITSLLLKAINSLIVVSLSLAATIKGQVGVGLGRFAALLSQIGNALVGFATKLGLAPPLMLKATAATGGYTFSLASLKAALFATVPAAVALTAAFAALTAAIGVAVLFKKAGELKQLNDELESFEILVDGASNSALKFANRVKQLADKRARIGLTPEEERKFQGYNKLLTQNLDELENYAQGLDRLAAQGSRGAEILASGVRALIKDLTDVQLSAKPIEAIGSAFEQLTNQVKTAMETLMKGTGDPMQFQKAAKELVGLTQKQFELGLITKKQAEEQLSVVIGNLKVEYEAQLQAIETKKKIFEQDAKERIDRENNVIKTIETAIKAGEISQIEGARRVSELKKQQLDRQEQDAKDSLKRQFEDINRATAEQIKLLEDRKKALQPRIAFGDQQAVQEAATIEKQIQEIQERSNQAKLKALKEYNLEVANLANERKEQEITLLNEEIKEKERRLDESLKQQERTIADAERNRKDLILKLRKEGFDGELALERVQLEGQKQNLKERLALVQEEIDRRKEILALIPEQDERRVAEQEKINGLIQKQKDILSELNENEYQLQQNFLKEAVRDLELQTQALDNINKLLSAQKDVFEANQALAKATADRDIAYQEERIGLLQQAKELINVARTEEEKAAAAALAEQQKATIELEKQRIARERLIELGIQAGTTETDIAARIYAEQQKLLALKARSFEQEQIAARQRLEAEIQIRDIQNKQLEIQAQIALANAKVSGNREAVALAESALKLAQEQVAANEQIAVSQRETLKITQETARVQFNLNQQTQQYKNQMDAVNAGVVNTQRSNEVLAQGIEEKLKPAIGTVKAAADKLSEAISQGNPAADRVRAAIEKVGDSIVSATEKAVKMNEELAKPIVKNFVQKITEEVDRTPINAKGNKTFNFGDFGEIELTAEQAERFRNKPIGRADGGLVSGNTSSAPREGIKGFVQVAVNSADASKQSAESAKASKDAAEASLQAVQAITTREQALAENARRQAENQKIYDEYNRREQAIAQGRAITPQSSTPIAPPPAINPQPIVTREDALAENARRQAENQKIYDKYNRREQAIAQANRSGGTQSISQPVNQTASQPAPDTGKAIEFQQVVQQTLETNKSLTQEIEKQIKLLEEQKEQILSKNEATALSATLLKELGESTRELDREANQIKEANQKLAIEEEMTLTRINQQEREKINALQKQIEQRTLATNATLETLDREIAQQQVLGQQIELRTRQQLQANSQEIATLENAITIEERRTQEKIRQAQETLTGQQLELELIRLQEEASLKKLELQQQLIKAQDEQRSIEAEQALQKLEIEERIAAINDEKNRKAIEAETELKILALEKEEQQVKASLERLAIQERNLQQELDSQKRLLEIENQRTINNLKQAEIEQQNNLRALEQKVKLLEIEKQITEQKIRQAAAEREAQLQQKIDDLKTAQANSDPAQNPQIQQQLIALAQELFNIRQQSREQLAALNQEYNQTLANINQEIALSKEQLATTQQQIKAEAELGKLRLEQLAQQQQLKRQELADEKALLQERLKNIEVEVTQARQALQEKLAGIQQESQLRQQSIALEQKGIRDTIELNRQKTQEALAGIQQEIAATKQLAEERRKAAMANNNRAMGGSVVPKATGGQVYEVNERGRESWLNFATGTIEKLPPGKQRVTFPAPGWVFTADETRKLTERGVIPRSEGGLVIDSRIQDELKALAANTAELRRLARIYRETPTSPAGLEIRTLDNRNILEIIERAFERANNVPEETNIRRAVAIFNDVQPLLRSTGHFVRFSGDVLDAIYRGIRFLQDRITAADRKKHEESRIVNSLLGESELPNRSDRSIRRAGEGSYSSLLPPSGSPSPAKQPDRDRREGDRQTRSGGGFYESDLARSGLPSGSYSSLLPPSGSPSPARQPDRDKREDDSSLLGQTESGGRSYSYSFRAPPSGIATGGIVTPIVSRVSGLPRIEVGNPSVNTKPLENGIQQLNQEFRGLSERLMQVLDRPQQVNIDGSKLGNNTMALYQGIKTIMEVGA